MAQCRRLVKNFDLDRARACGHLVQQRVGRTLRDQERNRPLRKLAIGKGDEDQQLEGYGGSLLHRTVTSVRFARPHVYCAVVRTFVPSAHL